MEKGKFGIRIAFYGVTAFILAFLGYTTPLFMLLGVALIAEKNDWAVKQIMQAILLCIAASIVSNVLGLVGFVSKIPVITTAWYTILNIINSVIDIVVAVFCVIGIMNTAKGKDAGIPLAKDFADWAYGIVTAKPVQPQYQQPVYQQPVQPQYQQPVQPQYQQPVQPQQQPVQPQQPNNQQ